MNPLDYIGVALWFTPVAGMRKGTEARGGEMKGTEKSKGGERETTKNENVKNTRKGEVNEGENIGDSGSAFEKGDMAPESVKSFEQSIRSEPIEHGQFFDKDGNPLSNVISGEKGKITGLDAYFGKVKDGIFTHNHPEGGLFSEADLNFARDANLGEIRATTPDGTTYSAQRPEGGWSDPEPVFRNTRNEMRSSPEAQEYYKNGDTKSFNKLYLDKLIKNLKDAGFKFKQFK